MNFIVGSDHAGWNLKQTVIGRLKDKGHEVFDAGPENTQSTAYSKYALIVAHAVAKGEYDQGVLICGSGLGMSMAANRVRGVRAALCNVEYLARMARAHNNANILCMGERVIGIDLAMAVLDAWLESEYEGGRHQARIDIFDQVS